MAAMRGVDVKNAIPRDTQAEAERERKYVVQREDCGVYRVLTRSVRAITVPVSAGQSGYLLRQIPSLSSKSHPHMTIPPQVLSYSRGDSADPLSQISTPLFSLEKGDEKRMGEEKRKGEEKG